MGNRAHGLRQNLLKHPQIASVIRRQIVGGTLRPGARLPTRIELERQFAASTVTIQKALDRLSRDGFVAARRRHGTFVVEHPPHLSRYAMVFFASPSDFYWGRFWQALASEAGAIERSSFRQMPCFYGIQGHEDNEDYQKLLRETRAQRFAGLIFTSPPIGLRGTPLLDEPDLPRVGVMGETEGMRFPRITHDGVAYREKAMDYLEQRGRRKVAVLTKSSPDKLGDSHFMVRAVLHRGFEHRPYWRQSADAYDPTSAQGAVHAVFHSGQDARPDALIITDDMLVEGAVAGLVAAGVRVPDEVEVIAHCNFPAPPPVVLPIKRLGYDARQTLRTCINSIEMQRRGETPPALTTLPALFDHEIPETRIDNATM